MIHLVDEDHVRDAVFPQIVQGRPDDEGLVRLRINDDDGDIRDHHGVVCIL